MAFNHLNANFRADARLGREADELHAMRPLREKYFAFSRGLDWAGMWSVHDYALGGKIIVDSYDPWHYCDEAHKLYLYSSIAE